MYHRWFVPVLPCLVLAACTPAPSSDDGGEGESGDEDTTGSELDYPIRLTFEGLEGQGLTLRQGDDELLIGDTGLHEFPTRLQPGQSYEVELLAQPRWPSQTCTLDEPAGVIADGAATVALTCENQGPAGLDSGYGEAGLVTLDDFSGFPDSGDVPFSLALTPAGGVIVGGQALSVNEFDGVLWRLDPDGSIDTSFGDNGLVLYDAGDFETFVAVAVAGDGSVYALGRHFVPMAGADMLVVRTLPDGSLDPAFGQGGAVLYDNLLGGCPDQFVPDNPMEMLIDQGGLIVAGSSSEPNCDDFDAFAARLDLASGALDPAYGDGGVTSLRLEGVGEDARNDIAASLAPQGDGSLWVAGVNTAANGVAQESAVLWRLSPEGSPDVDFGDLGASPFAGDGSNHAWAVANDNNDALIAGEEHGDASSMAIWRVLSSGELDESFGEAGTFHYQNEGRTVSARRLALDSQGRIIVAGSRNNLANNSDLAVWRVLPDGTLDESFSDAGLFVWAGSGMGREVAWGLTLDAQDRVIVSASAVLPDDDVAMIVLRIDD